MARPMHEETLKVRPPQSFHATSHCYLQFYPSFRDTLSLNIYLAQSCSSVPVLDRSVEWFLNIEALIEGQLERFCLECISQGRQNSKWKVGWGLGIQEFLNSSPWSVRLLFSASLALAHANHKNKAFWLALLRKSEWEELPFSYLRHWDDLGFSQLGLRRQIHQEIQMAPLSSFRFNE